MSVIGPCSLTSCGGTDSKEVHMPRMDGTGPAGAGSMTGLRAGPCGAIDQADAIALGGLGLGNRRGIRLGRNMGAGCGRVLGFGRGFGYNRHAGEALKEENVKIDLQERRDLLKAQLEMIDKRLATL